MGTLERGPSYYSVQNVHAPIHFIFHQEFLIQRLMKSLKRRLLNYYFPLTLVKAGSFDGELETYLTKQNYCTNAIKIK